MFSIFHDVLALVKYYDQNFYSGIEVDFQNEGVFYDENQGLNWWNYYCEPIKFGNKKINYRRVRGDPPFSRPWEVEYHTSRSQANQLIRKYIHFKPEIQMEIDQFEQDNFSGKYVIGVHYRGTDKSSEAPRVPYQVMVNAIQRIVNRHSHQDIKIFVATDEQNFINYIIPIFGDLVCYKIDSTRSVDDRAIHMTPENSKYQIGREAILDCVLLSRTDYLIRTSSNLSRWSTFFNHEIPVQLVRTH